MSFANRLADRLESDKVVTFSDIDPFKDNKKGWLHTGSPQLEYNLGILGMPYGIIEIAGKSGSGKTTLALHILKSFQKTNPDGVSVILSSEERDNKAYAIKMGIDVEKVVVLKFKYVEELSLLVDNFIKQVDDLWLKDGHEGLPQYYFMWDSIGATLSKSEFDTVETNSTKYNRAMGKEDREIKEEHAKPGAFAKAAKLFAKWMLAKIYDRRISLVMLNHTMAKIGGQGRVSAGGEWKEYFPTIRLETVTTGYEKLDDEQVAQYTLVKVIKNDFGSRKETDIEILLGYGLVLSEDDIEYGIQKDIIEKVSVKKRAFMKDKLTWSSKREFYELYKNPSTRKFVEILHKQIAQARHKDVLKERGIE